MNEKLRQTFDLVLNTQLDSLCKKRRNFLNKKNKTTYTSEFLDTIVKTIIQRHKEAIPDKYASYYWDNRQYDINQLTPLSVIRFLFLVNDIEAFSFGIPHITKDTVQFRQNLLVNILADMKKSGFDVVEPLVEVMDEIGIIYQKKLQSNNLKEYYQYDYFYYCFLDFYERYEGSKLDFSKISKILPHSFRKESGFVNANFIDNFIKTIFIIEPSTENISFIQNVLQDIQPFYTSHFSIKEKIFKALTKNNLFNLTQEYFPEFINNDLFSTEALVVESFTFDLHKLLFKYDIDHNCISDLKVTIDYIIESFNEKGFLNKFNSDISLNPIKNVHYSSSSHFYNFTLTFSNENDKNLYKQILKDVFPLCIGYLKNDIISKNIGKFIDDYIEKVIEKSFLYLCIDNNTESKHGSKVRNKI